jgi:hypothetical protein
LETRWALPVLLEGGEHGALAAPIARDVVKAYFDKKARLTQATPHPVPLALLKLPEVIAPSR